MEHCRSGILKPLYFGHRALQQDYLRILMVAFHGCGVASEAFIASTEGWSLKGAGPLCLHPHSLLSAGAVFPTQSAHYFVKPRTRESSHATGCLHTVPARLRHSKHICEGCYVRNKLNRRDVRSAFFSFSAGTAETVSGGCNNPFPSSASPWKPVCAVRMGCFPVAPF